MKDRLNELEKRVDKLEDCVLLLSIGVIILCVIIVFI
jgi:hypothetical protein